MQEVELKRRGERRFKKEREREEEEQSEGKKQEVVFPVEKSEIRELYKIAKKQIVFKMSFLQPKEFKFKELKMREGGFNKVFPEIIVSKIPSLQPKEIKEIKAKIKTFFTEIPAIKTIKREMPKTSIETKPFKDVSRKILAFNIMIPSTEKKVVNLAVPDLRTKHFDEFKVQETNFNLELPEMSVPKRQVFVPGIGVKKLSGVKVKEKVLKSRGEAGRGEETKEERILNFFEFLLGKGAGRISGGKPVCIIVKETNEKYEELIAILCRDIFREKIGGKPTPIYRETIEELRHEFESLVERRIIVVKKVEESSKDLIQILKGFFSQDMGFLILVSPEPLKLEAEIRRSEELSAGIITVSPPPEIEREEIRDELLKIVRGKKSPVQAESFGEEFKKSAENLEEELIRKYLNYSEAPDELKYNWDRLVASSPDGDEDASSLHSVMKAFVWIYEWKKHGKKVIPELEANRGEDVRIEEEGKNYEIETLFGRGNVRGHLTKKIKKYDEGEKIYFVLKNLDILRNLSLFSSFKRYWRKAGYKVEFFGLDLDKEELVPLKEFTKVLKSQGTKEG